MKKIVNSLGEEIVLNDLEKGMIERVGPQFDAALKQLGVMNALGYERTITTLTSIQKKVTEQKFFEIAPADYMPIRVGEGAWSSELLTYREYTGMGTFENGLLNLGGNNTRLANNETGVDSLSIKVIDWTESLGWSIIEIEKAAKSGNWDIVSSKERARKRVWDLGIQKIAFLGVGQGINTANKKVLGLLNQNLDLDIGAQVKIDTTLLTNSITSLAATPTQLAAFLQQLLTRYRNNCQRTAYPTHFLIPESDYNGMLTASSPDFPLKSIMAYMEETLKGITKNPNFKVMSLSYGDAAFNGGTNQCYVLLNHDEESIRMDIPVDYTNTLANSIDNFNFQNAAYGEFTGVKAYRPTELYYIQFPASNLS